MGEMGEEALIPPIGPLLPAFAHPCRLEYHGGKAVTTTAIFLFLNVVMRMNGTLRRAPRIQ